jgi:ABC-type branched-subunit amino acid transport system ATPase component
MNKMELLETIDIVKKFGGLRALDGVTMSVKEGEIAGLIGPNGSGKTTLFKLFPAYYLLTQGKSILMES